MLTVIVPLKRVNPATLKAELLAAGVPAWQAPLAEPAYAGSAMMALVVPDGSDPDAVALTVAANQDERTAEQVLRALARRLLDAADAAGRKDRAIVKLMAQVVVPVYQRFNALRTQLINAGLPLTVQPLAVPTWEQVRQFLLDLIDDPTT